LSKPEISQNVPKELAFFGNFFGKCTPKRVSENTRRRRRGWQEDHAGRFCRDKRVLADEPKVIAMDPYVSFGRPVLEGTGITTAIIAERYKAGESIEELARDYECPLPAIQEAIRCELDTKAA
jgi:uncharacterized protein (DUF433 family)